MELKEIRHRIEWLEMQISRNDEIRLALADSAEMHRRWNEDLKFDLEKLKIERDNITDNRRA